MTDTGSADVDAYIGALPEDRRAAMEAIRRAARAGAPEAQEAIAYGMPALRGPGGRFLVSYDAFRAHYSLFPASEAVTAALGAELTGYLAGRGTIRFPADAPIPAGLVTRVVQVRLTEIGTAARRR